MKRLSVLWLVEHLAREMDATCAAASLLRSRHGIDVEIWHMYRDAETLLRTIVPDVVVHPFFYFVKDALATEDYVACWPDAVHFNLAWEQIHYPAHQTAKAPADAFTRQQVLHHAWGEFYRRYLLDHGVPDPHIFVNGHPAYALYAEPYRHFYKTRRELAVTYGLDESARWVFVPENYRWAFLSDKRIATFERWGGNSVEAAELRDFSRRSLADVLAWCATLAERPGVEVIFRTRPSTSEDLMRAFVADVPGVAHSRIRFNKRESVREWILAADVVVSSYSTSLIEASLAGKPAFMLEPLPIPPALGCEWYDLVPSLTSSSDFVDTCLRPGGPAAALAAWARGEMLRCGDPIAALATRIAAHALERKADPARWARAEDIARVTSARLPARTYFNQASHDQDAFDQAFIEDKIRAWARLLNGD